MAALSQDFSKEEHWDGGTCGKMQINVLIPELIPQQPQCWGHRQVEGLGLVKMAFFPWKGTGGGIRDWTLGRKPHNLKVCVSAESRAPQVSCALLPQPASSRGTGMEHPNGNGETWDKGASAGGRTGHSSSKMRFVCRVSGHNKTLHKWPGCTEVSGRKKSEILEKSGHVKFLKMSEKERKWNDLKQIWEPWSEQAAVAAWVQCDLCIVTRNGGSTC